jgi:SPP1 family predicted phage head-tail adaptor
MPIAQKHRITLQHPATGQDTAGQPAAGFVDLPAVWANIKHASGLATIKADANTAVTRASIRVRWRTDVQVGWRVVHAGTVYKVLVLLPDLERRQHLDLVCEVLR